MVANTPMVLTGRPQTFAGKLKMWREQCGMTQERFAARISPILDFKIVRNWEQGRRQPPPWVQWLIEYRLRYALDAKAAHRERLKEELERRNAVERMAAVAFDQDDNLGAAMSTLKDMLIQAGVIESERAAVMVQVQIGILTELRQELDPLLDECLATDKRTRFAQGLAEIAQRYGAQPTSATANVLPMPPTPPDALAPPPCSTILSENAETPVKPPETGKNGSNGDSDQGH